MINIRKVVLTSTLIFLTACSGGGTRPDGSSEPNMLENIMTIGGAALTGALMNKAGQKAGLDSTGRAMLTTAGVAIGALTFGKLARYFSEQDKKNAQTVLSSQNNIEKPVSWCGDQPLNSSAQSSKAKVKSTCPADKPVITLTAHQPTKVEGKECLLYKTEVEKNGKLETEEINTCTTA